MGEPVFRRTSLRLGLVGEMKVGDWVKVPMRTGLHKGFYRWTAQVLEIRDDGFVKVTLRGPNQGYWERRDRVKEIGPGGGTGPESINQPRGA